MTAQPIVRPRRKGPLPKPSAELTQWLGNSYHPPTEPIDPATFNPHPWPAPGPRNREDRIYDAALDCFKRGYPIWHATLAIRDWNACNSPAMDLIDLAQTVRRAYISSSADEPDPVITDGSYLRLSEHCSDTIQPRRWLVPGILPAGQRTALVGKWGSGKSWLALDMAMAIVFGSKFLGDTPAASRGPVVILDGEGGGHRASRSLQPAPHRSRNPREIPPQEHGHPLVLPPGLQPLLGRCRRQAVEPPRPQSNPSSS